MTFRPTCLGLFSAMLLLLIGCNGAPQSASGGESIVLVSVTSDVHANPQSVDMAMKLAGFAMDEDRKVAMFFSVKGVGVPTKDFDAQLKFGENQPIAEQLRKLIDRGAEIHVCPICMGPAGIEASDLIEGAQVTTRPKLFANIGADTAVFTY